MRQTIWIVVSTADIAQYREPRINELLRTGVDILYPRRFGQARRLLRTGDRIAIHFGGRAGSHPWAQHLVAAGRIQEEARPLAEDDAERYATMWGLTGRAFKKWNKAAANGIIRFDIRACQVRAITPLPRTSPGRIDLYRPRGGDNFIPLQPNTRAHQVVHDWWRRVAD